MEYIIKLRTPSVCFWCKCFVIMVYENTCQIKFISWMPKRWSRHLPFNCNCLINVRFLLVQIVYRRVHPKVLIECYIHDLNAWIIEGVISAIFCGCVIFYCERWSARVCCLPSMCITLKLYSIKIIIHHAILSIIIGWFIR